MVLCVCVQSDYRQYKWAGAIYWRARAAIDCPISVYHMWFWRFNWLVGWCCMCVRASECNAKRTWDFFYIHCVVSHACWLVSKLLHKNWFAQTHIRRLEHLEFPTSSSLISDLVSSNRTFSSVSRVVVC